MALTDQVGVDGRGTRPTREAWRPARDAARPAGGSRTGGEGPRAAAGRGAGGAPRTGGPAGPQPAVRGKATLDGMFTRAALRKPAGVALNDGAHLLTYAKAEAGAVQLATALVRGGVQLGDPVVVHCDNHAHSVLAQLAVLKAGGVCVPVEPGADAARVRRIALISAARTVLCSRSTRAPWVGRAACLVMDVGTTWSRVAALRVDRALPRSEPTDAAYLLVNTEDGPAFGGQLVDHRAWGLALDARIEQAGRATCGVWTSPLPLGRAALSAMWWAFRSGGVLHIPSGGEGIAGARVASGSGVAVLDTREYRQVLEAIRRTQRPVRPRMVVLIGSPCPPELAALHFEVLPTTRLRAEFAPSGGAVPWTAHELSAEHRQRSVGVVVGRPVPRAQVRVLDADGRAVSPGLTGEICATGAALPFDSIPGSQWATSSAQHGGTALRSGRLGRQRPDGALEITGVAAAGSRP
ncbi:AMP-binding protein [Streptomyces iconiensis]|uniref:AMP-binding protein n=1 Tax=Streptomyces iconiensis TaxID=1384038 RepID=A0ABT6ZX93_9ACTN|nr:AMP-binding protein [Streptomyces iconiensis]MDJ1133681.1 AMP-binding protein [Streptomyces iconiensis]